MTFPNLYHLKYFVDAVELGSVTAAARRNYVSHPAISQAIRSLEQQLDLKLMRHRKKSFEVSAQGHQLATRARAVLLNVEALRDPASVSEKDISGTVVLGMSRSIAHAFLSPLLRSLKARYPKIRIKVRFGTTSDMVERTVHGATDMSMTIGYQPMPTLRQMLLHEGNFTVIQPRKKAFVSNPKTPYVLTKPQYETELLKKSYYGHYADHLPVMLEVGSWDVISQLVADGQGYGLVPDISLTADRRSKIKPLATPWFKCTYQIYLNDRVRNQNSAAKNAVVGQIRELFSA